jgi:hypothetical protein
VVTHRLVGRCVLAPPPDAHSHGFARWTHSIVHRELLVNAFGAVGTPRPTFRQTNTPRGVAAAKRVRPQGTGLDEHRMFMKTILVLETLGARAS